MTTDDSTDFEGWAIVELMGHRRLAGFVAEQTIAGQAFLRLDIAGPEVKSESGTAFDVLHDGTTQFYSPSAVYCITPTTQDIAVAIGRRSHPAPVHRFELEPPPGHGHVAAHAAAGEGDGPWYGDGEQP